MALGLPQGEVSKLKILNLRVKYWPTHLNPFELPSVVRNGLQAKVRGSVES